MLVEVADRTREDSGVRVSPMVNGIAAVAVSSLTAVSGMLLIVGGEFTVSLKKVFAVSVPSLTVNVMVLTPACPATGLTVTVRLAPATRTMLLSGTSAVLVEAPE